MSLDRDFSGATIDAGFLFVAGTGVSVNVGIATEASTAQVIVPDFVSVTVVPTAKGINSSGAFGGGISVSATFGSGIGSKGSL